MATSKIFGPDFLDYLGRLSRQVETIRAKRMVTGKDTSAVLKTQKKFQVGSVTEYVQAIKQFKAQTQVRTGYWYTFTYAPDDTSVPMKKLRFYDLQPLAFIYAGWKSKSGNILWTGVNFHRLPVIMRQRLVNALFARYKVDPLTAKPSQKILATYASMLPIVKKVAFAVRNYRNDRIYKGTLKLIPLSYVRQLVIFYPETLYKAPISELMAKYLQYTAGGKIDS